MRVLLWHSLLCGAANGLMDGYVSTLLDRQERREISVRPEAEQHHLYTVRVCNAYVSKDGDPGFHVHHAPKGGESVQLTNDDTALHFKQCGQFSIPLKVDDAIRVGPGDDASWSYDLWDPHSLHLLKADDGELFLAFYRTDPEVPYPAFKSHMFSHVEGSELAVLHTFRGKAWPQATIRRDAPGTKEYPLPSGQVFEVEQGHYELKLGSQSTEFVTKPGTNYALLVVGFEDEAAGFHELPSMLLYDNAFVLSGALAFCLAFFI